MVENSEGDMYHGCDICSSLPNVSNSMQRYLERVALSICEALQDKFSCLGEAPAIHLRCI